MFDISICIKPITKEKESIFVEGNELNTYF